MAENAEAGRPMPQLVILLVVSFVLMLLSGIAYGLGLPQDWARAFFMATVLLWVVLGVALIVQGRTDVQAFARSSPSAQVVKGTKEGEDPDE